MPRPEAAAQGNSGHRTRLDCRLDLDVVRRRQRQRSRGHSGRRSGSARQWGDHGHAHQQCLHAEDQHVLVQQKAPWLGTAACNKVWKSPWRTCVCPCGGCVLSRSALTSSAFSSIQSYLTQFCHTS